MQIKIFFKKKLQGLDSKEITSHVVPDQVQFGAEYFLAYTLPDFKSKISTQLLDAKTTMVHCYSTSWVSAFKA
jgi:hypothetical protein